MAKHEFDINVLNEVRKRRILWDSRVDDYRDSDKKPALWLEIADKLSSTPGEKFCLVGLKLFTCVIWVKWTNAKIRAKPS